MKMSMISVLLAMVILLVFSGSGSANDQDIAELKQQLIEIEQFKKPDMPLYLEYFTDELTLLPPDRPAITDVRLARARNSHAGK